MSACEEVPSLLMKASRQLKTMFNSKLAEMDLTFAQLLLLKTLDENEKTGSPALSPCSIAGTLGYDRPTVSGIVDRLVRHGMVNRLYNPEDRRSQAIVMTDKARSLVRTIDSFFSRNERISLLGFDDDEARIFKSLLMRVIQNLEQAGDRETI